MGLLKITLCASSVQSLQMWTLISKHLLSSDSLDRVIVAIELPIWVVIAHHHSS